MDALDHVQTIVSVEGVWFEVLSVDYIINLVVTTKTWARYNGLPTITPST